MYNHSFITLIINLKVFVLKEHDIRLNIDIDQLLKYANQQLKQFDTEFNLQLLNDYKVYTRY